MVILMPEDLNQKISQFMDDELNKVEALHLLKKMRANPDMSATLNRYQAMSSVIKNEQLLPLNADFVKNISAQIKEEPSYLLPNIKFKKAQSSDYRVVAVAASLFIVAIMTGHSVTDQKQLPKFNANLQVANIPASPLLTQTSEKVAAKAFEPVSVLKVAEYPLNKQISDYLQVHKGTVELNSAIGYQPYARLSSYSQK